MARKTIDNSNDKKQVLVVEDDQALRDAFNIILEKEGYKVNTATDGKDALDFLKNENPDLILLDLLMPEVDGKEFLKRFDNTKKIPIIVFSNLDNHSDVKEVLDLGAERFMLKAWASPKELAMIIDNTLSK